MTGARRAAPLLADRKRWKRAALEALGDPTTWGMAAGAAIGNFTALFIHDAFLGRTERVDVGLRADREEGSLEIRITLPTWFAPSPR